MTSSPSPESTTSERLLKPHRVTMRHRVPTLVAVRGPDAGRVLRLRHTLVLGRGEAVDVPILDPKVSRRHVIVRCRQRATWVEDLGSKNGTFVNGVAITKRVLEHGDQLGLGPRVTFRYALQDPADLAVQQRLHGSSARDALTGAYNARYFDERLHAEAAYASRHDAELAVLLFEIDALAVLFEAYGPDADEAALVHVARILQGALRPEHALARYGVALFALACPGLSRDEAVALGEGLAVQVHRAPLTLAGVDYPLQLVCGVGQAKGGGDDLADQVLGEAYASLASARGPSTLGTNL
ncbi:MAG: FHA domain-containing protein [Sandaracinaceae bacterium]